MDSNKINFYENKSIGQIFTPDFVADFMVRNLIALNMGNGKNLKNLKCLEPSAGEGIFLKYLLENQASTIHAFEMDTSLKEMLLTLFPTVKFEFNNFLGSNTTDKYDIIIGNPPYLGQNYNATVFQEYVRNFPICKKFFIGNMDLFYFFIHLGIEKLSPGGFLSFITTNYWITKSQKTGIKFLKPHILDECFLIQYIDLSPLKIFENARGQHNCIFVLQKKNNQEKVEKRDKEIHIIQILSNGLFKNKPYSPNELIFKDLINNKNSPYIRKYTSALTNNDLSQNGSWNLLYPKEVKFFMDTIENYCTSNGKILRLNDFFIIRNGLILINDNIFILKKGKDLKIENNDIFIRIHENFIKLNEFEKHRLKKIYKSKSIVPYGYINEEYLGYLIYFNKNEFRSDSLNDRNLLFEEKYPSLTRYIKQFEDRLREILINAKENPDDFYFPRRGSFIRQFEIDPKGFLIDLEPSYDFGQKIFFKYISNYNVFGYADSPYFATSDTYFLWPKLNENSINILFLLAYLNSSLVTFLYKAKNITIKRSKTKLEYELPIPNLNNFKTEEKIIIINLIENLTSFLIGDLDSDLNKKIHQNFDTIMNLNHLNSTKFSQFRQKIYRALKTNDKKTVQRTINIFIFQIFDIDEIKITKLLKEYYDITLN